MIVGSLLLILVAVTLLVMGLAAGSSVLLISSIVASLLAAVALVIGARQASVARRAAGAPSARGPAADPSGPRSGAAAQDSGWDALMGDADRPVPPDLSATETVVGHPSDRVQTIDTEVFDRPSMDDADGTELSDAALSDAVLSETVLPDVGSSDAVSSDDVQAGYGDDPYADFHRAQSAVEQGYPDPRQVIADDLDEFPVGVGPADFGDEQPAGLEATDSTPTGPDQPVEQRLVADGAVDDGLEHGDEDPADEPAPQRTQPADAVRVSRMVAEVLVVDGRPRYHLADCVSLGGRTTEALPVAEAVELGFTPCSRCRPVDRLVAEAVPR